MVRPTTAYILIAFISLLSLIAISFLFYGRDSRKKLIYFLVFGMIFLPLFRSVLLGQPTFLLFLICSAVLYLLLNGSRKFSNNFISGLLTGLLFFKPQFLMLTPIHFVISRRRLAFTAGFVISVAALVIWSALLAGENFLSQYLHFLSFTEIPKYGTSVIYSISAQPILRLLPFIGTRTGLQMVFSVALFAVLFGLFAKKYSKISEASRTDNPKELFSLILFGYMSVIFCGYHVQAQDLMIIILPLFEVLYEGWIVKKSAPTVSDYAIAFFFVNFIPFASSGLLGLENSLVVALAMWAAYANVHDLKMHKLSIEVNSVFKRYGLVFAPVDRDSLPKQTM